MFTNVDKGGCSELSCQFNRILTRLRALWTINMENKT